MPTPDLTAPLSGLRFEDLFDPGEIQAMQDAFAEAAGVASIITDLEGNPLTLPSRFCRLCRDIVRQTPRGLANCIRSDAILGEARPDGVRSCVCHSAGLFDGGTSIRVGERPIAKWLIGQVLEVDADLERLAQYAREIGVDEADYRQALAEVPRMSTERFQKVCDALDVMARQMSALALRNFEQARDLLERKQAQQALSEAHALLQTCLDQSVFGIVVVSHPEKRLQLFNQTAAALLGVQDSMDAFLHRPFDQITRPWADFRPDGTPFPLEESPLTLALRGIATDNVEHRIVRADGSTAWALFTGKPVLDNNGNLIAALLFLDDITQDKASERQRENLEAQVRHAQKLESLGVLAGGIAHDFNNLLMAILGNADLALCNLPADSPARPNLADIEKASRRAAELCKQMLAYSGRGRFVIESVHLSRIVEEMSHILAISISKQAVLKYSFSPGAPPVEADATQIRQIIMNLITNASDAIGDQSGVIALNTGAMNCDRAYLEGCYLDENLPDGEYSFLEVTDSGTGMDPATLQKIFDPFFTTKFTGRGLGLAAVLGIVRGHRGAIRIRSEIGKGTTFRILLPADLRPTASATTAAAESEMPWRGTGTVLLVDDEPIILAVGQRMLETLGFEVLTAPNGREALKIFRKDPEAVRCVLLDLTMPHMNGEETFRAMRRLRPGVRVLMSSGYNEQEVAQRFPGKGLAGFLQKPYKLSELRAKFQTILDHAPPEPLRRG